MTTYFTADTHFGHARLIDNGARPFRSVAEMDQAIVDRWNAVVGPDDHVWHLGDFSAYRDGKLEGTFWRLNGKKHLIPGNHDEENEAVLDLPWFERPEKHALIYVEGEPVFLSHYPHLTWPEIAKDGIQLFGHLHAAWAGNRRQLDVGVDAWDFAPVTMDQVKRRLRTLPPMVDIAARGGKAPRSRSLA